VIIRGKTLNPQGVITIAVAVVAVTGLGLTSSWFEAGVVAVATLVLWFGTAHPGRASQVGPYAAVFGAIASYYIFRGDEADREFYVIAAEVIPLLFLALVAGRLLVLVDKPEPERRIQALVIYFLVLGEGFSLYVLASGNQPSGACGWTVGALVAAAIAIISGAVAGKG
jgi:hypothetical protein